MIMSAQTKTRQQILTQLVKETRRVVSDQFPQAAETLLPPEVKPNLFHRLLQSQKNKDEKIKIQVTLEEYQATRQKLIELIHQPVSDYHDEGLLYLEQQLSDLLNFTVSASQGDYQIPYIGGVMAGLPHLKRSPHDQLSDHQVILEAGLKKKRSFYGWFDTNHLTAEEILAEKYYLSLPINLTTTWLKQPRATAEWFKYKKLIVINPVRELAVVAVMADIGPYNSIRAQFGGSPEVIHAAEVWHPNNKGRVAVFFVEDSQHEIPLGIINLKTLVLNTTTNLSRSQS